MGNVHYRHLESEITKHFSERNMKVAIEPHGSLGPDLEGINGTTMVGEIKHRKELKRDLIDKYWSDWNSRQQFGGKSANYKISGQFPKNVNKLDKVALGWIAVVYGQLNHYRNKNMLSTGWLVFEGYNHYYPSLHSALSYLQQIGKISSYSIEQSGDIGFAEIEFNSYTQGGCVMTIVGPIIKALKILIDKIPWSTVLEVGRTVGPTIADEGIKKLTEKKDVPLEKRLKKLEKMRKKKTVTAKEYKELREKIIKECSPKDV